MPVSMTTRSLRAGLAVLALSTEAVMAAETWPDLPAPLKNGIAARVGDMAFVGLGSAGTDLYALDLSAPAAGWQKRASFIGPATNGAAVAVSATTIYLFSGNGKAAEDDRSPIIFDTIYAYDTQSDRWSKRDTKTPVGLSGAKAVSLGDGRIALVGGYNKALFDTYLAETGAIDKEADPEGFRALVASYMGMEPKAYRWNDKLLVYDPAANRWGSLGDNPYLPNCDPALVAEGDGRFLVMSGEIKPGLRTPEVKRVEIKGASAVWTKLADLPPALPGQQQEGVAGAYAGIVGGDVLLAGGANFPGARANAQAGRWFAHDGLKKGWRDEVYVLGGTSWKLAGRLPRGLAYGASFAAPGGLLIAGGEDGDGMPRADVFLLRWDGRDTSIEN